MRAGLLAVAAVGWALSTAGSALAADDSVEARLTKVEQRLDQAAAPSSREIRSAVDAYLASAGSDSTLVGGAGGSAGYDGGFWIRGGTFLMKINLTIQTRFEAFRWDDEADEPSPGGDLSGFSLPRVTLKFSGDATCDVHYYAELEFGHPLPGFSGLLKLPVGNLAAGSADVGTCREAWVEYESSPAIVVRMGLLKVATTRQLMTPPELQQFIDICQASAWLGNYIPGYTDRNRDYGLMLHGVLGCDGEWSYLITVTNGDGPATRNVLDTTSNDNLAYSARVNWDIKGHIGYEEGALRQHQCEWVASVGAWAYAYTNILNDKTHVSAGDILAWGVDAAVGYGGWSFTGAYDYWEQKDADFGVDLDGWAWFAQLGYLFPDTAWEVAARYGWYTHHVTTDFTGSEIGAVVNYYIDGHSDKLSLDAAWLTSEDDGSFYGSDVYAGYRNVGADNTALMLRFQWQLAL
jgi:hypothetical protein